MIQLIAVDAEHLPDAADLAAANVAHALGYMGWSRPTIDMVAAMRAAGIGVGWIFESAALRCFEGYPAGLADGTWTRNNRDLALPGDLQVVVLGDTPGIEGFEGVTGEYAHGFMDGYQAKPDLGYGCEAAMIACASYVKAWWGVEVWTGGGFGKRRGLGTTSTSTEGHLAANLEIWRGLGAAMVQAYGPGPVPNVANDLNVILNPAALGMGHLIPTPEDDMGAYWLKCNETQQWAAVSEFRVAAYPFAEMLNPPAVFVTCTKAELDAEIKARQDLADKFVVTTGAAGGGVTLEQVQQLVDARIASAHIAVPA